MVDKRTTQATRKKQQPISEKNALSVDMWRFYLMWSVVLLCFLALVSRAFYVQVINKDFLQNKANANILRTEKIKAMRGVSYVSKFDMGEHIGVIAQEVERVVPEVVHTHSNGLKSVAYQNLVGLLIEAIKDLEARISELEHR